MTAEATATTRKLRAPQSAPRLLSRRVLVTIRRDQTATTPRVIWQHELPILEEMFGEGNVAVVEPTTLDEGYNPRTSRELLIYNKEQDKILPPSETANIGFVFTGDPQAEFQRLVAAYGMHVEDRVSNAEKVYGRFQDGKFAAVLGTASLEDLPPAQLRQLITDYAGPERAKATKDEDLATVAAEVGVEIE